MTAMRLEVLSSIVLLGCVIETCIFGAVADVITAISLILSLVLISNFCLPDKFVISDRLNGPYSYLKGDSMLQS